MEVHCVQGQGGHNPRALHAGASAHRQRAPRLDLAQELPLVPARGAPHPPQELCVEGGGDCARPLPRQVQVLHALRRRVQAVGQGEARGQQRRAARPPHPLWIHQAGAWQLERGRKGIPEGWWRHDEGHVQGRGHGQPLEVSAEQAPWRTPQASLQVQEAQAQACEEVLEQDRVALLGLQGPQGHVEDPKDPRAQAPGQREGGRHLAPQLQGVQAHRPPHPPPQLCVEGRGHRLHPQEGAVHLLHPVGRRVQDVGRRQAHRQ
mmetsp:Transcript_27874/g.64739  ORF Transcript_27874/g.64739 Transcript_27874/m.64739 type:complete len:262 (+) Transcript_27874:994-1779(+)